MISSLICTLPLPSNYRIEDILAFHKRDKQEIAEKVGDRELRKGIVWMDLPACLTINFTSLEALVKLEVDGEVPAESADLLPEMAERMLGLDQNIEMFEAAFQEHPQLGGLISERRGLRVPVTSTPFEALTWAITGQQISVSAAVSIRRKLIMAANVRHSQGLFCYPDAHQVASLTEDDLKQAGFSTSKAKTLLILSRMVAENIIPLDSWARSIPVDEIRAQLLAIPGIGPWTVNYALLRGFGYLDGSLHGDVAIRRGLQVLFESEEKISDQKAEAWLGMFSPWRALIAAHIWAAQSSTSY